MSTPTCEAILLVEATMPCLARTGSRDAAATVVSVTLERNRGAGAVIDVASKKAITSELKTRRKLGFFMEVIIVGVKGI